MVDITDKKNTLREAIAQAIIRVNSSKTIDAIRENKVPKGDVFEISRAAGLLGIKKTSELLPDCHPIPIEFASFEFKIKDLEIKILCTIKTIYKTGVEVEAMHGVTTVALNMYDMLKPIDKEIEIENIKLLEKKGGKSDYKDVFKGNIKASVIVCSDTISKGQKQDKAGLSIIEKLESFSVNIIDYIIIPDEFDIIQNTLLKQTSIETDLVIFTGGTGLSKRDVTPEAIKPLLDRDIPGISEASRKYGQDRTPYSMLSRSIAGVKDKTLVLALPGSTKGATESMDALFPALFHIFKVFKGIRHDS